jgi:hypothetical protein
MTLHDLITKFETWEEKQLELRDLLLQNPGNDIIAEAVNEERAISRDFIVPVFHRLNEMVGTLQGEEKQTLMSWAATKPYLKHIYNYNR